MVGLGAGNDFIIIDDRSSSFPKDNALIINQLCNRHMGIGADGLILVQNSTVGDFKMIYFNADGNLGSLCGNGGRCVFAFARSFLNDSIVSLVSSIGVCSDSGSEVSGSI